MNPKPFGGQYRTLLGLACTLDSPYRPFWIQRGKKVTSCSAVLPSGSPSPNLHLLSLSRNLSVLGIVFRPWSKNGICAFRQNIFICPAWSISVWPCPNPPTSSQASASHPTLYMHLPTHSRHPLSHSSLAQDLPLGLFPSFPITDTIWEIRFRKSAVGDYSPAFPFFFPWNRISASQTCCDLTTGGRRWASGPISTGLWSRHRPPGPLDW